MYLNSRKHADWVDLSNGPLLVEGGLQSNSICITWGKNYKIQRGEKGTIYGHWLRIWVYTLCWTLSHAFPHFHFIPTGKGVLGLFYRWVNLDSRNLNNLLKSCSWASNPCRFHCNMLFLQRNKVHEEPQWHLANIKICHLQC